MTPRLGILMLDTDFPRPRGDIGNPESFPFPVRYATVPGATAQDAVLGDEDRLLAPFVAAGRRLVAEGCSGLATSCGFLAPLQTRLAAACHVPVAASALMLVPMIARSLPEGTRPGIVTIRADALGPRHLSAAGIAPGTPVSGCDPRGHFARAILENRPELDPVHAEACVVDAAQRLVKQTPEVGGIVLECTNMGPYRTAVQRATGRPVWSVIDLLIGFHAGLPAASGQELLHRG